MDGGRVWASPCHELAAQIIDRWLAARTGQQRAAVSVCTSALVQHVNRVPAVSRGHASRGANCRARTRLREAAQRLDGCGGYSRQPRGLRHTASVSICTFVLVKQVN